MRLKTAHISEFQSVRDSNQFETGDITCLVGKNEAGKTTLLQALYRLNPLVESDGDFDVTDDYPRTDVEDYRQAVENKVRKPATVVQATYFLEEEDLQPIVDELGKDTIKKHELILTKGYENKREFSLEVSLPDALKHLYSNAQLPPEAFAALVQCSNVEEALTVLGKQESTTEIKRLTEVLTKIKKEGLATYIYQRYLEPRLPKFLYFDEFYQMKGHENIEALKSRVANGKLKQSDYPLLGLVALARLDLDDLLNHKRTQELVNKLEGASNHLSKKILKYWSQNKHIQIRFDVRPARPEDPAGMREGTNIWARIYDSRHMVSTNLGTRSRGFVWFFSFLAWYSQKKTERVILLLDEPGLSLHAKAQDDLLRYFEEELKPTHQLIYTTHSPFMVDPKHFERVRIVQDTGIDTAEPLPREEDGTKVFTEVLEASRDSLFPLQGALGYEIYQTLFVGPNSLVVEGVSDLVYLQTISALLQEQGRIGLSSKWTITPVGGADKVPTFVALVGSQKGLRVAVLVDIQKKDKQTIENLYKKKLLQKKNVLTYAELIGAAEADVEDLFEAEFYLRLTNEEFHAVLEKPLATADLNSSIPRIGLRLEAYFQANPLKNGAAFNHYRPARYLSEKLGSLKGAISDATLDRFEKLFKRLNGLLE